MKSNDPSFAGDFEIVGSIAGYSRSCLSTSLYLEKYKLLLDAGPLAPYLAGSVDATKILITHLHHDHWSGLISLLGLKKCRDRFNPVHIYSPRGSVWFLKSLLMELRYRHVLNIALTPDPDLLHDDGNRIPVILHGLEGNYSLETHDGLVISAFNSSHHCEGIGFKLSIRRDGGDTSTRILTYTGDTSIAALDDDVLSSPVIITECTYLESEKTQKALERGHMSIDNIVNIESRFKGHRLLLTHFKGSYTDEEIRQAVEAPRYVRLRPEAICTKILDTA